MSGGTIKNNFLGVTGSYGNGVAIDNGTFTMSGGAVGGNKAANDGSGVYVNCGTFNKTSAGGVIYGKGGGDNANKTVDSNRDPHDEMYAWADGNKKYRDTTIQANEAIAFSSTYDNEQGRYILTFTGAWDK